MFMATTLPSQVPDPASLPVGTEVDDWRVVSWSGRGANGTVYRVVRRGHERQGPYALKMALHARDERFMREEELLSRISHPSVPRLEGRGVWRHAAGGFPYLVMQWVEGVTLYEWAAQRNPTSRQVLRLMAQIARAIEATAAAKGLHRDVKGDNILVQPADERAFLIDFGAGVFRGAKTLTVQPLPPATPNYRSPEAWGFQRLFAAHPTQHYQASVCDELFALGVTAYRLVTDEYPPPTEPGLPGSEVWARKGPGPRPPRQLNPHVCPQLDALIMRLLSSPERRFKGSARLAAEAFTHAADQADAEADAHLFDWETVAPVAWTREEQRHAELHGHRLRRRDKATVHCSEQKDAQAKAEAGRTPTPHLRLVHTHHKVLLWLPWIVPSIVILALAVSPLSPHVPEPPHEEPVVSRAEAADAGTPDGGPAGAGEEVLTAPSVDPAMRVSLGITAGMIKGPLPGQRKPPCLPSEDAIRGGCWRLIPDMKPPCETGYYEWDRECFLPIFSQKSQPTSDPQ
jgi:serine/threonine protein kinase